MIKGSKGAYITTLVGTIVGGVLSLWGIVNYFIAKSAVDNGAAFEQFAQLGVDMGSILMLGLIMSIVGLVLSIVLAFIVKGLAKKPTKKAYIWATIIGAVGLFTGMSIGGLVVVIGGIIGIVKSR